MREKKTAGVVVVQNESEPIPTKVIAQAIVRIDATVTALLNSGLTNDALVTLLNRMIPPPTNRTDIERVLTALSQLRKKYTNLPASKGRIA